MNSSIPTGSSVPNDPLRSARAAMQAGQFQQAWNALNRLAETVRQTPDWLLLAAVTHFRLGEFARCRATALQARDGFRGRGDVDGETRAENTAAAGAFALGQLADAEQGFQRALGLAHHLGDEFTTARCANNLGNVAYYLGDHPRALGFYRLATASFENAGSWQGMAEAWLNSAIVWRDDANVDQSRDAADRAIAAAERAGNGRLLAQALAARAETSLTLGDVDLARAQVGRALDLSREHADPLAEADALRILTGVERLSGNLDRAMNAGEDGLAIARRLEHPWAEAELQRDLALVLGARGRAREAQAAYEAAAAAFERLGSAGRAERMRTRASELAKPS